VVSTEDASATKSPKGSSLEPTKTIKAAAKEFPDYAIHLAGNPVQKYG